MEARKKAKPKTTTLQERASRLSAAVLRINASLDVTTVLREVMEEARALTGARYGMITTVDDSGNLQECLASGLTPEGEQQLLDWPDGPRVLAHFQELSDVVKGGNLRSYVRGLGYSGDVLPATHFEATPISHLGVHIGNLFVGGKKGGRKFSPEEEEILLLFASQAANAIVNARTHHKAQRTRADQQTLVDTSPVGVVVFDAKAGKPMSFNHETRRLMEGLCTPDTSPQQFLELLTVERADGQEVSFHKNPRVFQTAEVLRAEEMVLRVPDGRSVKALVNATPIRSADGEVERLVVTLQDLGPLEELERLRAEFLGMVSHELRAPLTSIKGSTATVLGASGPPNVAEMVQFFRIIDQQADRMSGLLSNLLDAGRIEAGTLSVSPESTEVSSLVERARHTFLTGGSIHTIVIDLAPDLPRVMADRERIVQVLNNLLSNAARHSPESSPIRLSAKQEELHVVISVSDEGNGVPPEKLPQLFQKYTHVDEGEPALRGSGLGLAICKGLVEAHGGRIWATSGGVDQGTQVTFTIPVLEEAAGEPAGADQSRPSTPREAREPTPILVVDDDPQTLRYVRDVLGTAGYSPVVTGDHRELSRIIRTERPQLVLLDLLLAGTDGIELMENIPELADLPVIFISGYGRDETIARALETGAADYIVKPFSPTELTARIRAALRRRAEPEPFVLGDLAIHYEERQVTMAGQPVQLTATEYDLLRVLSVNAGRVTTYDSLIRQVWGGQDSGDPELVRTFVKKLRHKLDDSATQPAYIFNERGVGYRMARPDPS